jgi:hypothetical protein
MAINNVYIQETDTTLLSVPADKKYAVTTILVCNYAEETTTGANDTTFDLHVVKGSGGVKSDLNKIIHQLDMPAGETFTFSVERVILETGDRLVAVAPVAGLLSATISYLEV